MKVKDYKELRVWQKGIEIVDKVYRVTYQFPRHELYGLTSQMRKAAVSIPSNIAEGFMRKHSREYQQFLRVYLGSCAELDTQLVVSRRRDYINDTGYEQLAEDINHESRMLVKMISSLQRATSHEPRVTAL